MSVQSIANSLDLRELQGRQRLHDEMAHRDILSLNAERQLTHFTLHFTKYAGLLFATHRIRNYAVLPRILTDSFIIALASANTLSIDLSSAIVSFGSLTNCPWDDSHNIADVLMRYGEVVGTMAKACEAFDHPAERYPSYEVLARGLTELAWLTLLLLEKQGIEIRANVLERWRSVEAKAKSAMGDSTGRRASVSAAA